MTTSYASRPNAIESDLEVFFDSNGEKNWIVLGLVQMLN